MFKQLPPNKRTAGDGQRLVAVTPDILVCLLTGKPTAQFAKAKELMVSAEAGRRRLLVSELVFSQAVLALEQQGASRSTTAKAFRALLALPSVVVCVDRREQRQLKQVLENALGVYAALDVSFKVASIGMRMEQRGPTTIYSDDAEFDRLIWVTRTSVAAPAATRNLIERLPKSTTGEPGDMFRSRRRTPMMGGANRSTVSSKGQVVIPKHIRDTYDIRSGDRFSVVVVSEDTFHLIPERHRRSAHPCGGGWVRLDMSHSRRRSGAKSSPLMHSGGRQTP